MDPSVERLGANRATLHQRFEATGLLVGPFWPLLRRGMVQFERLGTDLARHLDIGRRAAADPG